jgi:hypothetical protein
LVVLGAVAGPARAASPGSTDDLALTTTHPGTSTGIVASEVFNARYTNGDLKPIRHSLIALPEGTTFDTLATDTCTASPADFQSKGMSACPASTQIGTGQATVVTSGTPVELGPFPLDATIFARTDGSIMVFSEHGVYVTSQLIHQDGRFQTTDTAPSCIVPSEAPGCEHGQIVPRSLSLTIPARSRVIDGVRHTMITTPPTCPPSGSWEFSDKHTFADGSVDLFVNHPPCDAG